MLTIAAIGIPAYLTSKQAIEDLWQNLASEISDTTAEVSLRFLSSAKPVTEILAGLVHQGDLDVTNQQTLLEYSAEALQAYPNFSWVSFSSTKGSYVAAYYPPDQPVILGTIRNIDHYTDTNQPVTKVQNSAQRADGTWNSVGETISDYDPRVRPFWIDAIHHPEGAWVGPFKDLYTGRTAFAFATPQYAKSGELIGLWEVEFRSEYLTHFLSSIELGRSGHIWIVNSVGEVIAASSSKESDAALLAQAWEHLKNVGERSRGFSFDDYLAYIQSFSSESQIPWKVLTVVPKADFLGPIETQALNSIVTGGILCILFATGAAMLFGRISKQLKGVAAEMTELGAFRISEKKFEPVPTLIDEVHTMHSAIDQMKVSLGSFAKYVPLDLVRDLIKSGQTAQLGGKKAELTLMFSDLVGFTEMAERLSPVKLLDMLSTYFTQMSHIVAENQGEVDKYIGDAIMAFWGAPEPLPQHAIAACRTVLAMQKKLAELKGDFPPLKQRIGINTGPVIVGNIGSPDHMEYTAIGDTVNLASRLEGLNKYYGTQILVGETTKNYAESEFVFRPIDWVFVKGRLQTTLIWELIGTKADVSANHRKAYDLYEQALFLYRSREFIKAALHFEEVNDLLGGSDRPSQLMADKSRSFIVTPPEASWEGATPIEEK